MHVHWWLVGLAFLAGFGVTLVLVLRPVKGRTQTMARAEPRWPSVPMAGAEEFFATSGSAGDEVPAPKPPPEPAADVAAESQWPAAHAAAEPEWPEVARVESECPASGVEVKPGILDLLLPVEPRGAPAEVAAESNDSTTRLPVEPDVPDLALVDAEPDATDVPAEPASPAPEAVDEPEHPEVAPVESESPAAEVAAETSVHAASRVEAEFFARLAPDGVGKPSLPTARIPVEPVHPAKLAFDSGFAGTGVSLQADLVTAEHEPEVSPVEAESFGPDVPVEPDLAAVSSVEVDPPAPIVSEEPEHPTGAIPIEPDHAEASPVEPECPTARIPVQPDYPDFSRGESDSAAADASVEPELPTTKDPDDSEVATRETSRDDLAATEPPVVEAPPKSKVPFFKRLLAKKVPAEKEAPPTRAPARKRATGARRIPDEPPTKKMPAAKAAPARKAPNARTGAPKKPPPAKVWPAKKVPPAAPAASAAPAPSAKAPPAKKAAPAKQPPSRGMKLPYEPFGPGSARATSDGGGPAGWFVKGRSDTRLYYTPDDPTYELTIAQVWFKNEEAAARAHFTPWCKSSKNIRRR
ncbi:hypothetical protein MPRM_51450 [Mycobacterium parmense]|uniref:Membrane protein ArfC n=2 Tax=Mycobacterium parmense TaxID=185642 RepID=A0A7I7Z3Q5_9MYCO|nr:hypothetical protein MPRM_51450 [Mycobacterium parmense]